MKGQELKRILTDNGLTITEVANKLGTSQQNLSCALKAADVKTGLLEKICAVYGFDMTIFYPIESIDTEGRTPLDVEKMYKDNIELRSELLMMQKEIEDLRKANLRAQNALLDALEEKNELRAMLNSTQEKRNVG